MLYSVALLFPVLTIYSLAWPFGVQAKMFADCTFGGMSQAVGDQKMAATSATFSGKLASYQNLSHSCVVKTKERNHFLHVKAKRNKQSKGKD